MTSKSLAGRSRTVQIDLEEGNNLSAGSELRDENGSECSVPVVFSIYHGKVSITSSKSMQNQSHICTCNISTFPIYHIYNPSTRVDLIIAATKRQLAKTKRGDVMCLKLEKSDLDLDLGMFCLKKDGRNGKKADEVVEELLRRD